MEDPLDFIREQIKIKTDKASWVYLTTITFTAKFAETVNLQDIYQKFATPVYIMTKGPGVSPFKWELSNSKFYNQISIEMSDSFGNKNVKIFPNGSIQCTGCTDLFECKKILTQVATMVGHQVPDNMKIAMINSNFSLNGKVNLFKLFNFLRVSTGNHKITFDPDKYCAPKISLDNKVQCSVFQSGKVIINGAKTLKGIIDSYVQIIDMVGEFIYGEQDIDEDIHRPYMGMYYNDWCKLFSKETTYNVK